MGCCKPNYIPVDCDSERQYKKYQLTKLDDEHIDYITSAQTLQN